MTLWTLLVLYYWLVDPKFGRRLGIVLALSIVTNQVLKETFSTSRPYDLDVALSTTPPGGRQGARLPERAHAERGHLLPASPSATAAVALDRGPLIVFAVALSRVYLGVHMPDDVTGGFVLGSIFAWVAGGWSGPPTRPGALLWSPLVGVGTLALTLLGVANGSACGLLAGCFLAQPAFAPPRTAIR